MANAVGVILAAGPSLRMRTDTPKPLHRVCGRPLLEYALDVAAESGLAATAVVTPAGAEAMVALVGERAGVVAAGDTVAASIVTAAAALPEVDHLLVIPADLPQLRSHHLKSLLDCHVARAANATLLVAGGTPTGVYALRRETALSLDSPAALDALVANATTCNVAGEPLIDVDTRADLARAEKALRQEVIARLMAEGVTFIDPESTFVDAGVRIGRDTVVYPWTFIEGQTEIGGRCRIGPHVHLVNCVLDDDIAVEASVLRDSRLAKEVRVGPFAHLRPGSAVGAGTKIGDYVELKNAQVGAGVSIAHLAYVGDATVGDRANIGAGVITCNFDGIRKNRTTIGDDAFIGSNSVLIAPVTIGSGATWRALVHQRGSPADALGIARSRQENKPDWARRRRGLSRKGERWTGRTS